MYFNNSAVLKKRKQKIYTKTKHKKEAKYFRKL